MNGEMMNLGIILFCTLVVGGSGAGVNGRGKGDLYDVGVGIADVTGPSAGLGFMGYVSLLQFGNGIHTRLFARSFIVKAGSSRVAFVSADLGMIDTSVKTEVIKRLQNEFGDLYKRHNVLLSATHTHSGPGGYIQYALYGISSLGFHKGNFEAIVEGIVESIRKAHYSLQPGRLSFIQGDLLDSNINRSPFAYKKNPPEERQAYATDVDKQMVLLRIDDNAGNPLGAFNWFAVHPTSMNNTNKLISGDNKGYASMLFEYKMNEGYRPGKGKFVAAFASSNLGDASPNVEGPVCRGGTNAGKPCAEDTNICGKTIHHCIAFGPGRNGDNEESTEIIGRRQFNKAVELFEADDDKFTSVRGGVQFSDQHVDMNNYNVKLSDGTEVKTCSAALGYSFAAGTSDGPGVFLFKQGEITGNAFWDQIREFLIPTDEATRTCHAQKPVLLNVGKADLPYPWTPSIVETQILRIGNFFLAGVPGEFTTMSGRRMRSKITEVATGNGVPQPKVVIAGLSNVYTHYVVTPEEYTAQRYEGASTLFGPNTLNAYLQQYQDLMRKMLLNQPIPDNVQPPNLMQFQISLIQAVMIDLPPPGHFIGQTKTEPKEIYYGGQTVRTTFIAGHPRNNPMRGGSYFVVERLRDDKTGWDVIVNDADWSTKFHWKKRIALVGLDSEAEVSWKTTKDAPTGEYRIRHFGYYKPYMLDAVQYEGTSRTFEIRKGRSMVRQPEERQHSSLVNFWKNLTRLHLF